MEEHNDYPKNKNKPKKVSLSASTRGLTQNAIAPSVLHSNTKLTTANATTTTLVRCSNQKLLNYQTLHCITCGTDASTQVRPKSSISSDSDSLAAILERQYVILTRITQSLRNMQMENQTNLETLRQLILSTVAGVDEGLMGASQGTSSNMASSMDSNRTFSNTQICDTDRMSMYSSGRPRASMFDNMKCPDVCPRCGNTIKVLMTEIDELRRSQHYLLHVRYEANEILDAVIAKALANGRVKATYGYSIDET